MIKWCGLVSAIQQCSDTAKLWHTLCITHGVQHWIRHGQLCNKLCLFVDYIHCAVCSVLVSSWEGKSAAAYRVRVWEWSASGHKGVPPPPCFFSHTRSHPPILLGGAAINMSGEQEREFSIYGGFIGGYCCHHVDFGTPGHGIILGHFCLLFWVICRKDFIILPLSMGPYTLEWPWLISSFGGTLNLCNILYYSLVQVGCKYHQFNRSQHLAFPVVNRWPGEI